MRDFRAFLTLPSERALALIGLRTLTYALQRKFNGHRAAELCVRTKILNDFSIYIAHHERVIRQSRPTA